MEQGKDYNQRQAGVQKVGKQGTMQPQSTGFASPSLAFRPASISGSAWLADAAVGVCAAVPVPPCGLYENELKANGSDVDEFENGSSAVGDMSLQQRATSVSPVPRESRRERVRRERRRTTSRQRSPTRRTRLRRARRASS